MYIYLLYVVKNDSGKVYHILNDKYTIIISEADLQTMIKYA